MIKGKLVSQLINHEGIKNYPYNDTVGKLTIGVGRNLTDRGLSNKEILYLLQNDIEIIEKEILSIFPKFNTFNDNRQIALIDMMFNLGYNKFSTFKKMIKNIRRGNWDMASIEALNSKWAIQVGSRAITIAHQLKYG